MEPFNRILSREQRKREYTKFRNQFAGKLCASLGARDALAIICNCRIGFDVQLEAPDARWVVKNFRKGNQPKVYVMCSLS